MQTIRARLTGYYLLVLAVGMSIAAILTWYAVSELFINTQRENLLAQARLIAAGLQASPFSTQPVEPYSQTSNIMPGIHMRLIGESGAVVVGLPMSDEMIQLPAGEQYGSIPPGELIQRPEIESALKGTPATALRKVIGNQRVLYAAAPVQNSSGQVTGIVYIAMPLPATGLPLNLAVQFIGAIVIAFFLAVLTAGILARRISTPLERLAGAALAVSKGDLTQAVSPGTTITELHNVGRIFNEMVESLHRSDEAKKAFIADVTHELRTPLTVIKGTIETLEDGALDDLESRSSLLSSMMREADRMIRMVNELLVLTRADAGSLPLNVQKLDLTELARMRCEAMSLLASRQQVELKVAGDSQLISADPDRISQVINNLLDNAIRHSPSHSVVTVAVRQEGDGVECSVGDAGAGISAKHLPFVFDRFYRVEASRDRISGGMGLGLSIARALVIAHGGRISASSVIGQGTTITFWLPQTLTSPGVEAD